MGYSQIRAEDLAEKLGIKLERKKGLVVAILPSDLRVYFTSYAQFVALVEYILGKAGVVCHGG